MRNAKFFPLKTLVLSLTGRCNLACKYCYASPQIKEDMSEETARRAIDMAARGGKEKFTIQLSGGEPLLTFPLIQKVVAYVREEKIPARIQLQTNATLITEEIAEFLAASRIAVGVSLDGRPSINDSLRRFPDGTGASAAAAAGISRLAARGTGIGLTCVVTRENVGELEGVIEMAYYFGNVRRIGFDLLRNQGRGANLVPATAEAVTAAMRRVYAKAAALAALTARRIHFSQIEQAEAIARRPKNASHNNSFSHCHAMSGQGVHVDAAGRIYACSSFVGDPRFYLGNVADGGIDPIRQAKTADAMRKRLGQCLDCEDFARCGGACFARSSDGVSPAECALKRASITAVYMSPLSSSSPSISR